MNINNRASKNIVDALISNSYTNSSEALVRFIKDSTGVLLDKKFPAVVDPENEKVVTREKCTLGMIKNYHVHLEPDEMVSLIRNSNPKIHDALMTHRRAELHKLHGDLLGEDFGDRVIAVMQRNQERLHKFRLSRRGFIG